MLLSTRILLVFVSVIFACPLIVTEFHPDPSIVADDVGEWFELRVAATDSVDLQGWTVRTATGAGVPLPARTLAPDQTFVVARSGSSTNGGVASDLVATSGWSLANASGSLHLLDPAGTVCESVNWGSGWPLRPGRSVERRGSGAPANDPGNWASGSTPFGMGDLGTPGERNAADTTRLLREGGLLDLRADFDGTFLEVRVEVRNTGLESWQQGLSIRANGVALTEVLVTSEAGALDTVALRLSLPLGLSGRRLMVEAALPPDPRPADDVIRAMAFAEGAGVVLAEIEADPPAGASEWVEIAQGDEGALDLGGWSIGDGIRQNRIPEGTSMPASGRLVLAEDCVKLRAQKGLNELPCARPDAWPRLAHTGDVLVLRDPFGRTRDSLAWNRAFWGAHVDGRTMERLSLTLPTLQGSSWQPCPAALGSTPGAPPAGAPGWTDVGGLHTSLADPLVTPDGDGREEELVVRVAFPRQGEVHIEIRDLERRRLREVWRGAPPASGQVAWDGRATGGGKVAPGAVLVLIKARLPDGPWIRRRHVAVVGYR